jgi:hypothetical protein
MNEFNELWTVGSDNGRMTIVNSKGAPVVPGCVVAGYCVHSVGHDQATLERICACVNALAGVPTEKIAERMKVKENAACPAPIVPVVVEKPQPSVPASTGPTVSATSAAGSATGAHLASR